MMRILIPTAAIVAAVVLTSSSAAADGRDFGHHVVHCAQSEGFDSTHNPGTHHGLGGFTAGHICVMA